MDVAGLNIVVGAQIEGALRGLDQVDKRFSATGNSITAAMSKATSSISAIAPASQKAASGVNIIGISFDKAAAKVDEISSAIASIPKPAPIVVDVIANTNEAIAAIKNIPTGGGVLSFNTQGIKEAIADVNKLTLSVREIPPVRLDLTGSPQLIKTVADVELLVNDLSKLGSSGTASVSQLTEALNILKTAQTTTTDTTAFNLYQDAIDKITNSVNVLRTNVTTFGGGTIAVNTEAIKAAIVDINKLNTTASIPVKIDIIVSQDIQQSLVGMEHLSDEIKQLATGGVTNISQLTVAIKTLKTASLSATDIGSVARYNVAIEKLTGEVTRLKGASIQGGSSIATFGKSSNTATLALTNLGRVAQDLPFGFIGIANNLNPLLESFQRLQAESKATGVSLTKNLLSSLTGAGGLGLALSVVSAALSIFSIGLSAWTRGFGGAKKAVDDAKQSNEDYVKSLEDINDAAIKGAEKEAVSLKSFVAIAQDSNFSYKQRLDAVVKLQEISPAYFGNLTKEQILYGDLTKEVDLTTAALLSKASAEANINKAAAAGARVVDIDEKRRAKLAEVNSLEVTIAKAMQGGIRDQLKASSLGEKTADNYKKAKEALHGLTLELSQAQLDQIGFLEQAKKFALLNPSIDTSGIKPIEGIFRDLSKTIAEINKKQIVTGTNLNKEKIDADKKAIEDLLKTSISLKDVRLTNLIDEFKRLGGSFDEAGSKSKTTVDKIKEVLDNLSIARDELNRDPLIKPDDKPLKEINLIQDAIKKLRDLKAKPEIIIGLRTEIGEGQGFQDVDPTTGIVKDLDTLLRKVIFKDINDFAKNIKPVDIPIPVAPKIEVEPFASGESADRALLIAQVTQLYKDIGIDVPVNIKAQNNFELTEQKRDIEGKLQDLANSTNAAIVNATSGIAAALGEGLGKAFSGEGMKDVFGGLFRLLGEGIKEFGKACIAYGLSMEVLKKALSKIFKNPAGAIAAGIALEILGSALIAKIPKFEAGGIATGATFGIFGEKGPEAILPLDRLKDFMPGNTQTQPIVLDTRISGNDIWLSQQRTQAKRGRTF